MSFLPIWAKVEDCLTESDLLLLTERNLSPFAALLLFHDRYLFELTEVMFYFKSLGGLARPILSIARPTTRTTERTFQWCIRLSNWNVHTTRCFNSRHYKTQNKANHTFHLVYSDPNKNQLNIMIVPSLRIPRNCSFSIALATKLGCSFFASKVMCSVFKHFKYFPCSQTSHVCPSIFSKALWSSVFLCVREKGCIYLFICHIHTPLFLPQMCHLKAAYNSITT